jgi:hypothetical protein
MQHKYSPIGYANKQHIKPAALTDQSANQLMQFLRDKNVMPLKPYMEPALRAHLLDYVPEAKRHTSFLNTLMTLVVFR